MDLATDTETISDFPLDVSVTAFIDTVTILNALGNEDALKIFLYAKDGIKRSKEAIQELGLTQKKYYSRLKDLLDVQLLEKVDGEYRYTTLGKVVYKLGISMEPLLSNKDRLRLADNLQKMESLSESEKRDIMQLISIGGIGDPFDLKEILSPVRMIDSYDDLVRELINKIDKSERNIYFATKYTDPKVAEATIRAIQRNIEVFVLSEKMNIIQGIQALRLILSPKSIKTVTKFLQEYSHILRQVPNLIYSFIIIDEKYTIIEIPHPMKNQFHLGFLFENPRVTQKLIEIFLSMWENSGTYSLF
ncbi:MAG: hypothetical protein ACTSQI_22255 [Candidatus Helarchaeota archaeon]